MIIILSFLLFFCSCVAVWLFLQLQKTKVQLSQYDSIKDAQKSAAKIKFKAEMNAVEIIEKVKTESNIVNKNRPRRASGYSSTFIPKQTFLHLL